MTDETQSALRSYYDCISRCLTRDRGRIVHAIDRLKRGLRRDSGVEEARERLQDLIQQSSDAAALRGQAIPPVHYPQELPIADFAPQLLRAIADNQVVIVAGETGSGKSTQLPKLCLAAGQGRRGFIGCTQPRRVAARALASRLREELVGAPDRAVGCKVRFSDSTQSSNLIKVMTDGVLLAEVQSDRLLDNYEAIIVDEAHERSLNVDFLLGYLHSLRRQRPDLKLIVTSATIDVGRFADYFGGAPVIEIPGRLHPVEVRYRPIDSPAEELSQVVGETVSEMISSQQDGDLLVFLPGEREIREAAETLRGLGKHKAEILPLYARQSAAEQARIFAPGPLRRVVLATNVAETSLTIPRIRFVIDSGTARVSRFSKGSRVQRLPVEPISRASADQRAGRCGRLGPGVCIRLYSIEDYEHRARYTDPEILRTNLASVILRMKALGIGDITQFPFLDAPEGRHIRSGIRELALLGALDKQNKLTALGRRLARFPIDPRFARMVEAGRDLGCLGEMLVIAAALSIVDPRERPFDKRQQADESHAQFCDPRSDFVSVLNLWRYLLEQKRHLSKRKFRALCQGRFLSATRVMEWLDVHRELSELALDQTRKSNEAHADYEAVHRAALYGLVDRIAHKRSGGQYEGMQSRRLRIFPGSCIAKSSPAWLVAAEWVETSQLFARMCAQIEPAWVLGPAGEFCRERYFDPYVEFRSGRVKAFCESSLFGLVIEPRRRVDYARTDPAAARDVFIHQALAGGRLADPPAFMRHNRNVMKRLRQLEAKLRVEGIAPTADELAARYTSVLPSDVIDGPSLRRWLASAAADDSALRFDEQSLAEAAGVFISADAFPEVMFVNGLSLRLTYQHAPGRGDDGVTAHIPLAALNGLSAGRFDWLVPGYLREKIAVLLKSLPKQWRKNFVPVPQFAAACAAALIPCDAPLVRSLSEKLADMTGIEVPSDAWQPDRLPPQLQFRFAIEDQDGNLVAEGRNLVLLQQQFAERARAQFAEQASQLWQRDGVTRWDFGDLPQQVDWKTAAGDRVPGFPALTEQGAGMALRLFDNPQVAAVEHAQGVGRLLLMQTAAKVKAFKRQLPDRDKLCLYYRVVDSCEALLDDLCWAVLHRLVGSGLGQIRDEAAFQAALARIQTGFLATGFSIGQQVLPILEQFDSVRRALSDLRDFGFGEGVADMHNQLERLLYKQIFRRTSEAVLANYPRYLRAISARIAKLQQDPQRDSRRAAELQPYWQAFWRRYSADSPASWEQDAAHYRWMLEEYRISLFAQELGTVYPISEKRLRRMWDSLEQNPGR